MWVAEGLPHIIGQDWSALHSYILTKVQPGGDSLAVSLVPSSLGSRKEGEVATGFEAGDARYAENWADLGSVRFSVTQEACPA